MNNRLVTVCLALVISACSSRSPIASSPVTLKAGSNEFKFETRMTPLFRRQQVQITVAGVVREEHLRYPSQIDLLFANGDVVTLSAVAVLGDGSTDALIYPSASCARNMPDGCVIGLEGALRFRGVAAVRVIASHPITLKAIDWLDYSPN
jgi:hypothetical protein